MLRFPAAAVAAVAVTVAVLLPFGASAGEVGDSAGAGTVVSCGCQRLRNDTARWAELFRASAAKLVRPAGVEKPVGPGSSSR